MLDDGDGRIIWRTGRTRVRRIVRMIIECAQEVGNKPGKSTMDAGQLLAYASCLSIIRDEFILEQREIGLGFDVDQYILSLNKKK